MSTENMHRMENTPSRNGYDLLDDMNMTLMFGRVSWLIMEGQGNTTDDDETGTGIK